MTADCRKWYVAGRVQGVCFRAYARAEGQRLELRGYVRNLPDGRVEVVACGPGAALHELRQWLDEGPPQARVEIVEDSDEAPAQVPDGFEIH